MSCEQHEYDIRLGSVCECCRQVLIELLKNAITNHKSFRESQTLNNALVDIIRSNGNRRLFHKLEIAKGQGKITQHAVAIAQLDITTLVALLSSSELALLSFGKCCENCKHDCECVTAKCGYVATCKRGPCKGEMCSKPMAIQCKYIIYETAVEVSRISRNTHSHCVYNDWKRFKEGKKKFGDFPHANNWNALWQQIYDAVKPCIKLLYKEEDSLKDVYKDFKMDMRIALRKDENAILKMCKELVSIVKLLAANDNHCDDIVHFEGRSFCFCDGKLDCKSFVDERISIDRCVFNCSLTANDKIIAVQVCDTESIKWHEPSEWEINGACIHIRELSINVSHSLRAMVMTRVHGDDQEGNITEIITMYKFNDFRITVRNEDMALHENKVVCFDDKRHKRVSAIVQEVKKGGCLVNCNEPDCLDILEVQTQVDNELWKRTTDYSTTDVDGVIEISNLKPEVNINIRLLLNTREHGINNSRLYTVAEYRSLKITGDPDLQNFEIDGNIMYISDEKSVTIDRTLLRKVENGVVVKLPNNMENSRLLCVKQKSENKEWQTIKNGQLQYNETKIVEIKGLSEDTYSIRIALEQNDGDVKVIDIKNIDIVSCRDLEHLCRNSANNITVFCHAFGESSDIHQKVKGDYSTTCYTAVNLTQILFYKGGQIYENLSTASDYLKTYFKEEMENGKVIKFPPDSHSDINHRKSFCSSLCDRIKVYHESQNEDDPLIIITQYGTNKHFRYINVKPEDYDISVPSSNENRITVFNIKMSIIINIRLAESCKDDLQIKLSEVEKAIGETHEDLKSLFLLHCDIIKRGTFALIGAVATNELTKDEVKNHHFCTHENCLDMILAKDHLNVEENFQIWWDMNILEKISEFRTHSEKAVQTRENFLEVPNRMMTIISLESELPCAFATEDSKRIERLLWNKHQLFAIYDEIKKKIIEGPYGSGKSLVGRKVVKNFIENNESRGKLYVITWDAYSLLFVELEKYCDKLKEDNENDNIDIICTNRVELSHGRPSLLSLYELMDHLSQLHPDEPIHLMLDEFDSGNVTLKEVKALNQQLQSSAYINSLIVIIIQSLEKERKVDHNTTISSAIYSLNEFKSFPLPLTMRTTTKVHKVIKISQDKISEKSNFYQEPDKSRLSPEIPSEMCKTKTMALDSSPPNSPTRSHHDGLIYPDVVHNTDKVAKQALIPPREGLHQKIMETKFQFKRAEGCGTDIPGSTPQLVRIPYSSDEEIVKNIIRVLKHFLSTLDSGSLFICNSESIAGMVLFALRFLNKRIAEYLHFTDMTKQYPTSDKKRSVYNQWKGDKKCILVTDNRGICGLQHKMVFVFSDEDEYHERYLLPEAISRATTKLILVTFRAHPTSEDHSPSTKDVIERLTRKHYVNELALGKEILMKQYDLCYKYRRRSNITSKQASVVLLGRFRTQQKDIVPEDQSTNKIYHELTSLIRSDQLEIFQKRIAEKPTNANILNEFGNDLSHIAAKYNKPQFIKTLLDNGLEMRKNVDGGWSAFHWAASSNSYEAMMVLISLRGDSDINDIANGNLTPLHLASSENHEEIVDLLLQQPSVNVDIYESSANKRADEQDGVSDVIKTKIKTYREKHSK